VVWRINSKATAIPATAAELAQGTTELALYTQNKLTLKVHPDKRDIGRTNKGFDFLGYHISPKRKRLPARRTLNRLLSHLRQLQEQGAIKACRLYVARWQGWFNGGLRKQVSYPEQLKSIFKQLLQNGC
jgi:hypothetical protein